MSSLTPIRRILTKHNPNGIAVVDSDTLLPSEHASTLEDARSTPIWVTESVPTKDNNNSVDGAKRRLDGANFGLVHPNGTNLRGTDLVPGGSIPMHRTSSVDYNILIEGEVILITEDGKETHLTNAGDVVIQKGTLHAWRNPNTEKWARWITVLVAAEPAQVGGRGLEPVLALGGSVRSKL